MTAYYNEIDPYAAQWLCNLILEGQIAPGHVDTRSIEDVTPNDLKGYTQCHFFAGIGVWSRALRIAGWPDDRSVWTGSCPCQPFSQAGKGGGFADERHLWPAFEWIIGQCRPAVIFGEQVASKDGLAWLDLVQDDLEATNHAVAPFDIGAAGVGAPHIRQRLYWVADSSFGRDGTLNRQPGESLRPQESVGGRSISSGMADSDSQRLKERREQQAPRRANIGRRRKAIGMGNANDGGGRRDARAVPGKEGSIEGGVRSVVDGVESAGATRELGNNNNNKGLEVGSLSDDGGRVVRVERSAFGEAEPVRGFWSGADWISCRDGKWRPVEPGTFPLASGIANRVGRLRAYGNSIVAPLAAEFIKAYLEC